MKAVIVSKFGGPEVLSLEEVPAPVATAGQVVVLVKAVGVNPVEAYIRAGTYPRLPTLPYVPGGNVAGTVLSCGPGVSGFRPGDRVYSAATLSGAYAEQSLCHADQLFSLPEQVDFQQGAAIGVPAATAWRGLFLRGEAKPGMRVLVHGASGSVGQAAIQLGRDAGLEMYGTAGSAEGLKLLEEMGAAGCFDHGRQGYETALGKVAGGQGFDLILEMLANKNLATDLTLLAPRGKVVIIGSRGTIEIDPRLTMGKETEIRGLAVFSALPEETRLTHAALQRALEAGVLQPRISQRLPLAEAVRAHELVLTSGRGGKIILLP